MRAKYFTANTLEEAEAQATAYFNCSMNELVIDIVSDIHADRTEPCKIVAVHSGPAAIANMNAFYALYYENDGVYLEIYARRGAGSDIDSQALMFHIIRKKIAGCNMQAVQALAEAGYGRARIANAQTEFIYGEDINIEISADGTEVNVRLLPPEQGGAMLTIDDAKNKLRASGVVHGIDDEKLAGCLNAKAYGRPLLVASATAPIHGEDGKLIFHFSTDERTGAPREVGSGGRVDYHSLDLYVPVTQDQLLVTRVAATEGQPGKSVTGQIISQRPGKEVAMPRGKNVTINDTKTEMISKCSGMVEFVNNTVNVSNLYSVKGDCDISVGNIEFEGSVQVSGSVRTGNVITATDGIFVGGLVEGATLIAGGNVEVKGGMQGGGKGKIEAGGSVSIMYIERGTISCEGPITVDVSIHSTLETGSTIQALGKRGAIIGGNARAGGDIVASFIGALSNTKTEIEVGFLPRKRARMLKLEEEMKKLKGDSLKLSQLDAYLEKSKGQIQKEMWDKLYISGVENKRINREETDRIAAEIDELRTEMENATSQKVHVFETAFGGARISIGSCSYKVTDDVTFATFRHSGGEIVWGPCEKSKQDFKV